VLRGQRRGRGLALGCDRPGLHAERGARPDLRGRTIRKIVQAGGADEELVCAQLEAVTPILRPPLTMNRKVLERWADFDKRFGIVHDRPDVERAFGFDLAE
jgi:hypothetical protein